MDQSRQTGRQAGRPMDKVGLKCAHTTRRKKKNNNTATIFQNMLPWWSGGRQVVFYNIGGDAILFIYNSHTGISHRAMKLRNVTFIGRPHPWPSILEFRHPSGRDFDE